MIGVWCLGLLFGVANTAHAQGSSLGSFTYQGRLDDAGVPANGLYDFSFALFTASTGGSQIGTSVARTFLPVTNGLFTVPLEFLDANSFSGADRWLEIAVHPSGVGTSLTLSPRQQITAAPYAIRAANLAGTVPLAQLPSAVVTNGASGLTLTGAFTGNGTGVTNVSALTLGGVSAGGFWKTNGNAGANPATGAFLGTTDPLPLELKVHGQRALRLEAVDHTNFPGAVNVIGGSLSNQTVNTARGVTIAGGGLDSPGEFNTAGGDLSTVGGGRGNSALAHESTVAGGRANTAGGTFNSTVGGGYANTAGTNYSVVAGGYGNTTRGQWSTIAGGRSHVIAEGADDATVGGGGSHSIRTNAWRGTVSGGFANTVGAPEGTVSGGGFNSALAFSATVGGGGGNAASGVWSTIAGGRDNLLTNADYATIGGGLQNLIPSNAFAATIPGGQLNAATDSYTFAAGRRAKANHSGTFVWADATDADFASTGANQFLIRAGGGVGINHSNPTGAALAVGGAVNVEGIISANALSAASVTTPEVISPKINSGGNVPLDLYVNGSPGLRIEPTLSPGTVNVIGGSAFNHVADGVLGATVWGGGLWFFAASNTVAANFGTVSGGKENIVAGEYGTVSGGRQNSANNAETTVAGGRANIANGGNSTVSGGFGNFVTGNYAAVPGGRENYASGEAALAMGIYSSASGIGSIAMGFSASAAGTNSVALGYYPNAGGNFAMALGTTAYASHRGSFVWSDTSGLFDGYYLGFQSTSSNQFLIRATGGVGIGTPSPGAPLQVGDINTPNSQGMMRFASRSGTGASSRYWDIGVPEGDQNTGGKYYSFAIDDPLLGTEPEVVVRWDTGNVGIGTTSPANKLDVNGAAIVRGVDGWDVNNTDGDLRVGSTTHRFKIGVAQGGGGAGDVWMRAHGGTARMFIKTPGGTTFYSNEGQTAGVSLAGGGGSWTTLSDRNAKENVRPVNAVEVLDKLAALPLSTWNYKSQDAGIQHLGPMAQDFKAAFGLGETETGITTVDADGVALAAIQGLNQKLTEELGRKGTEIAELTARLARLERLLELQAAAPSPAN